MSRSTRLHILEFISRLLLMAILCVHFRILYGIFCVQYFGITVIQLLHGEVRWASWDCIIVYIGAYRFV